VTVHAARKWLQGESIPTQEKLRALAGWLDVPADWLRFGNGDTRKGGGADTSMTDQRATALLSQLDEHHRQIGLDMLRALVRTYKKK
jgi:transcriptional regulator with XRE-family HTH domain